MAKMTKRHAPQVEAGVTRCPACGSSSRTAYFAVTAQEHGGISPDGKPYTHIVRRRTVCRNCGQHRVDRCYENRVKPTDAEKSS